MSNSLKVGTDFWNKALAHTVAGTLEMKTQEQIGKELDLTRSQIAWIVSRPEFQDKIKDETEVAVQSARTKLRHTANRLLPDAIIALESLLRSDASKAQAEGLKAYFRLIGIGEETADASNAQFTINLPGSVNQPKDADIVLAKEKKE